VIFLLVAIAYFIWGAVKNLQAVGKLAYTFSEGPLYCRDPLYREVSTFNSSLSRYFLYAAAPLFGKLILVAYKTHAQLLAIGVSVNASTIVNCAHYFQDLGFFLLVLFNWLCYIMFSWCWSPDLFNLKTSTILKLVVGLFFAPLLLMIQILVLPFMNVFFIGFLFIYVVFYAALFGSLLTLRIQLSVSPQKKLNTIFFLLKILEYLNNWCGFILGTYTLYFAMNIHKFLFNLMEILLEKNIIFISSYTLYNDSLRTILLLFGDVTNVLNNYNIWSVLLIIMSFFLLIFLFIFYTVFHNTYSKEAVLDLILYIRLLFVSISMGVLLCSIDMMPDTVGLSFNFLAFYARISSAPVLRRPIIFVPGALGSSVPDALLLAVTAGGGAAAYGATVLTKHTVSLYNAHNVRNGDIVRKSYAIQEKLDSHFGDTFKSIDSEVKANIFLEKCRADPRILETIERYLLAQRELKLVSDLDVLLANDPVYGSMHVYTYECIEHFAVERGVLQYCQVGSNVFLSKTTVLKSLITKVNANSHNAASAAQNAKDKPFDAKRHYVDSNSALNGTGIIAEPTAPSEDSWSLGSLLKYLTGSKSL